MCSAGVAKLKNIVFEHYVWYSVGNFLLISEVSAQTVQPLWSALDFCNPCFCVNNGNFRVKKSMEHYILYILLYTQNIVFEHYFWYSVGNFLLIFEVSAQTVQPLWSALDFCNPCFQGKIGKNSKKNFKILKFQNMEISPQSIPIHVQDFKIVYSKIFNLATPTIQHVLSRSISL